MTLQKLLDMYKTTLFVGAYICRVGKKAECRLVPYYSNQTPALLTVLVFK